MAKRLAVLDWRDIQSLVEMASTTFSREEPSYEALEKSRQHLVESLLEYLHEWLPGKEVDDLARIKLVSALESFSVVLSKEATAPRTAMSDECLRIRAMLRAAMGLPDDSVKKREQELKGLCLILAFLVPDFRFDLFESLVTRAV